MQMLFCPKEPELFDHHDSREMSIFKGRKICSHLKEDSMMTQLLHWELVQAASAGNI